MKNKLAPNKFPTVTRRNICYETSPRFKGSKFPDSGARWTLLILEPTSASDVQH